MFQARDVYRPTVIALLIEKARLHAALDQWSLAEKDLEAYFAQAPSAVPWRLPVLDQRLRIDTLQHAVALPGLTQLGTPDEQVVADQHDLPVGP